MKDSKEFLLGNMVNSYTGNPHLGLKFISMGNVGFIGNIVQIVDSIAHIKDPIILGRATDNVNKVNFIKFHTIYPMVRDEIQVPLARVEFMCTPDEQFTKDYNAAKAGLVIAVTLPSGNTNTKNGTLGSI